MLVLTRRRDESFFIGDNIKVTVVDDGRNGGGVRIGISAPENIPVHREEIWNRIKERNDNASDTPR